MVLVVTGRFDASATLAHIAAVFGATPKPTTPLPSNYTREPVLYVLAHALANAATGRFSTIYNG